MKKDSLSTPSIQSLDRGLFLLEAVAESSGPVTLAHLTTLLGIDRSSVFRLANTLKRQGFLANPAGRKDYILGPSVWRLSRKYDWSKMLITCSREHLRVLASRTGETTHLAVREGKETLFIDHQAPAPTNQLVVVSGQTGEFAPLYCTAHGKALLAGCGVEELRAIFGAARLQAYTPTTIVSIPELAKACAQIEQDGFAYDNVEYREEIRCLAAPVRDKDGVVVASIGISAPEMRFPRDPKAIARQVCDVAKEVTAKLGAV